jgi:hypothetical protein
VLMSDACMYVSMYVCKCTCMYVCVLANESKDLFDLY